MNGSDLNQRIQNFKIEDRIAMIEQVLGTLISWMAQSANSPISHQEAKELLEILFDARKA